MRKALSGPGHLHPHTSSRGCGFSPRSGRRSLSRVLAGAQAATTTPCEANPRRRRLPPPGPQIASVHDRGEKPQPRPPPPPKNPTPNHPHSPRKGRRRQHDLDVEAAGAAGGATAKPGRARRKRPRNVGRLVRRIRHEAQRSAGDVGNEQPTAKGWWARRPVSTSEERASATASAETEPFGRYHSTTELTRPKTSREVSRGLRSPRRSPSAMAAAARSATRWSNSRRRSSASRSAAVLPRTRSSSVT